VLFVLLFNMEIAFHRRALLLPVLLLVVWIQSGEGSINTGNMYIETCVQGPAIGKRDIIDHFGRFVTLLQQSGKRGLHDIDQSNEINEKSVPEFTPGVCGGVVIEGSARGGLIPFESLRFDFNVKADSIPGQSNADLVQDLFALGESLLEMALDEKRVVYPGLIDGKGIFRRIFGSVGFGSLKISKLPDSASASLFAQAAQNDDDINCNSASCSTCPTALFIILQLPNIDLYNNQESLYLALVPAVITSWELIYPDNPSTFDDVREELAIDFGSMVYAYGDSNDIFGLFTPSHVAATCNLELFCILHPCLCANNFNGKRTEEHHTERKRKMHRHPNSKKYLSDFTLPPINWFAAATFGCAASFGTG